MIELKDVHAFVDGELSPERTEEIRAILKTSEADAKEVEAIRELRTLLRDKTQSPPHQESWRACVKRLDELDKTKRTESIVSRLAPGFCFGLFVCVLLVGQFHRLGHKGTVSSPDLAPMIGSFSPINPPKGTGSADTAHWLDSLIHQSLLSTPDKLQVLSAARGGMDGIPVQRFAARDQNGDLAIYVFAAPLTFEGMKPLAGHADLNSGVFQGANCVECVHGENTIMIVAERTYEELAAVAQNVIR